MKTRVYIVVAASGSSYGRPSSVWADKVDAQKECNKRNKGCTSAVYVAVPVYMHSKKARKLKVVHLTDLARGNIMKHISCKHSSTMNLSKRSPCRKCKDFNKYEERKQ